MLHGDNKQVATRNERAYQNMETIVNPEKTGDTEEAENRVHKIHSLNTTHLLA